MSTPIKSLLASFKDSTELVDVHETYSEFSHDLSAFASRRTLKSEVADYFFNAKPLSLTTPPGPPILLPRLPTAGEPPQVAELTRARKNNAVLLEHIKADPLWLARRMPGQEAFRSVSRCFKFDTYYVAEEGTICFIQGARKLTYKQRKVVGKSENYSFNVLDLLPAGETDGARRVQVPCCPCIHGAPDLLPS